MAKYKTGDLLVDRDADSILKILEVSNNYYIYETISSTTLSEINSTRAEEICYVDNSVDSCIYEATKEELVDLAVSLSCKYGNKQQTKETINGAIYNNRA